MTTVHVLVPVFNRLALTREMLASLHRQVGVTLRIVIVDDGSTDGTADFLASQPDVVTLKGDGNLWWAGAMDLALRHIRGLLQPGEFFLFLNNDTRVDDGYVAALVQASQAHGRAVVGSIVRDAQPPHALLDIGPRADLWRMAVWDIARDLSPQEREQPQEIYPVDFLPGRGTLFPAEVIARIGTMRPRLLPHYHADYEYVDRARRAGFKLIVTSRAVTYSTDAFGNQRKAGSRWQQWFGKGSPTNVLQHLAFWSLVGSPVQRGTAVLRIGLAHLDRRTHRLQVLAWRALRLAVRVATLPLRKLRALGRISLILLGRHAQVGLPDTASARRAWFVAAAERARGRQFEVLQACLACRLAPVRDGHAALAGTAAQRLAPPLQRLGVLASGATPAELDLLLCARTAPGEAVPAALARQLRPGGVLHLIDFTPDAPAPDLSGYELLADSATGEGPARAELQAVLAASRCPAESRPRILIARRALPA